jgi:gamma-glutamylcyclotransferase (GGCT)/AIG2-like uncharacterized protein YtfP
MLYLAYGSNLSIEQMSRRCPQADPVSSYELQNWKLVFRGVADIVPSEGDAVQGGLWKITPQCEEYLDRYEGYRDDGTGMYRKVVLTINNLPDGEAQVMFYVMNSTGIYPPSSHYFAGIKDGYHDFGLPVRPLIVALEDSYDDKHPSHVERQRMRRTGRPSLAARPSKVRAEGKTTTQRKAERKAAKKAIRKAERRAASKANHDPWADTSFARPKKRPSLDQWLADKYYDGRRI